MYNLFLTTAQEIFNKYEISTSTTDALEETVLKIAGIENKPKRCRFGQKNQGRNNSLYSAAYDKNTQTYSQLLALNSETNERMYFAIRGLVVADNEQFFNYLNKHPESGLLYYFNDQMNAHYFEINSDWACEFLLPKIKERIEEMVSRNDPDLQRYQTQSQEHTKAEPPQTSSLLLTSLYNMAAYLFNTFIPNKKQKTETQSLQRYYIRVRQWDDSDGYLKGRALSRAFAQLEILSKNGLNKDLPVEINTLIASHIVNYHGTAFFGPNRVVYNSTENSDKKILYAKACYAFFKTLNGKSAEEKRQLYDEMRNITSMP